MLKELRWKFTKVAVISISIVFLALLICIGVVSIVTSIQSEDMMLEFIAENDGEIPKVPPMNIKPEDDFKDIPDHENKEPYGPNDNREFDSSKVGFRFTNETPFETRYFTIKLDQNGEIIDTDFEHIAAVTEDTAQNYVDQINSKHKNKGSIGEYRYLKTDKDDGTSLVILMDVGRRMSSNKNLIRISLILYLISIGATFVVGYMLSGKAVEPTVKAMESQKRFITDASHEMKTPITAISAYASVLQNEMDGNEWVAGIAKETDRLGELVTDLVELSRWDESTPLSNKEKFSLTDALWDVVAPYQNMAVAKGKELVANITEEISMTGDVNAIQRAVSTLLENSIKYSLEGSDIFIRAYSRKKDAIIEVQNACEKNTEADLDKLFDRFYRADPSRSRHSGGNGVGLSIAKAIVTAHGGNIKARYEGADQIVFTVRLPIGE